MRLFIIATSPEHAAAGGDGVYTTPEAADWDRRQMVNAEGLGVFETTVIVDPADLRFFDLSTLD